MPKRSASEIHAALLSALHDLRRAEKCAALHFAEILKRRLYRELGHPSIQSYAIAELGFTENKTREFVRLAESLDELPKLRSALSRDEITWTKARTVARVATPRSEGRWLQLAAFALLAGQAAASRDAGASPYQIVIYKCRACGEAGTRPRRTSLQHSRLRSNAVPGSASPPG